MHKFLPLAAVIALAVPAAASAAANTAPARFSVVTVGAGPDIILIPGLSARVRCGPRLPTI